jgi:hypothetical protein
MQFPSEESIDDAIDLAVQTGIFKVHNLNFTSRQMSINPKSITYDALSDILIYSESKNLEQLEFNPDLHSNRNL